MNFSSQYTIIDDVASLRDFRTYLATQNIVAVDTEFHAENRYVPQLMLMQIAMENGDVFLVDPIKVNPEPLGAAMRNLTIITHSGKEDVRLMYHALGLRPAKLFDVQIAAGMLGMHYPTGLQKIVKQHLDRHISKQESMTDWSKRPLQDTQLQYAAQDARVLLELFPCLLEQLDNQPIEITDGINSNVHSPFGQEYTDPNWLKETPYSHLATKADWAWEASKELQERALLPRWAGEDWLQWNVAQTLDQVSQRILTRLLEWRESVAERRNKPANYILPRSALIGLARQKPTAIDAIQNRRISAKFLKNHGSAILRCVQEGLADEEVYRLSTPNEKRREQLLGTWVQIIGLQLEIDPSLLLPRRLISEVARKGPSSLRGWREQAIGKFLHDFMDGRSMIGIQGGSPVVIPS